MPSRRQEALDYHSQGRPGKIQVTPTKPFKDQRDLSLAYTPGVAEPCLEIAKRPDDAYVYTTKGNLVAVVTNGTAVLGLGNIGALAGKPVMEGKGILFKAFADIDVFDLEVGSENPDDVIKFCQLLEPTVGGINLEDIRSPDCFYIEEQLRETLSIPVFHDDQHGTAIISGAALLNALELVQKDIGRVKVVFAGAGAAAIATAEHYVRLGVRREHIVLCDQQGVIHAERDDLDHYKARFAQKTIVRALAEALQDADVFVGLSVAGIVSGDMLQAMAKRPIVFALANPTPEISPEEAREARSDAIVATGRSDYPNQVNNVLGFPFIFRGALDVRAKKINEAMEMAATRALAALAKEEVPDSVLRAYGLDRLRFGPEYLIPKPFEPRPAGGAARRVPRGGGPAHPQGRAHPRRRRDRRADPAGRPRRDPPPGGRCGGDARGDHAREPAGERAPRDVRARAVGAAAAQGDHAARGPEPGARPAVPRAADASRRAGGRRRRGGGHVLSRRDAAGARGDRRRSGAPARERHLHAGAPAADVLLRRLYREHRSRRGDARGDRLGDRGVRGTARHRAARGAALVLELRIGAPPGGGKGTAGSGAAARARAGAPGGRGDAGGHGRRGADPDQDLSVLEAPRAGQRADLPGPRRRQHQLQAARPDRRRPGHRPDPSRDGAAGPRAAAGLRGERHRQQDRKSV